MSEPLVVYPVARGAGPLLSTIGAIELLGKSHKAIRLMELLAIVVDVVLISTQGRWSKFSDPRTRLGLQ